MLDSCTYCDCHIIFRPSSSPSFQIRRLTGDGRSFPSFVRMFSRSVVDISTNDRPPLLGSAVSLSKCRPVGRWLRPGERFQSGARLVRERRAKGRETLGGSSHACHRTDKRTARARNEKVWKSEREEAKEKERRGSSEGHASAQSLVRSQTNRRPCAC
jgi:hypothetical protein